MVSIFTNVEMLRIPMAISPPNSTTNRFSTLISRVKPSLVIPKTCLSTAGDDGMKADGRRSGNYKPPMWDFQYIQSIHNDYVGDKYMKRFNEIKKEMKKNLMMMMFEGSHELEKLEIIDNLHRLGVSYHFKDEIMQILRSINQHNPGDSLYCTALKFRLLRQHGFHISQDMLNDFKDENGNLKQQSICNDTKVLLQLYEASFFSTKIETTTLLESANTFTMSHLKNYLNNGGDNMTLALARHALELPMHWMMLRVETSWYLNIYEKMPNANPLLLELAKLDFNIVQATHQHDLRTISWWWKSSCLLEKLPFARDRIIEAFLWIVGTMFEPQHSCTRRMLTKVPALVTIIDDIYDVYGTLDELEVFTDAVERMEVKAMDQLPDYMKVCYLALFNNITEIAYEVLKEQGINVIPYLKKSWADLCKTYLREARWHYNGYTPSLEEYMDNAWISIGMPVIIVSAFFCITNPITKEALESLNTYPDIVRWCAKIVRLANDLGTSSYEIKRGDVPKSIQCYMNDHKGATEEEARKHINILIKETWKLINTAQWDNSLFAETFIEYAVNIARAGLTIYQHGDGHGIQNSEIKNRIFKLFFEPIRISIP